MNRARSVPSFDQLMTWSLTRTASPLTRFVGSTLIIVGTAIGRALFVTGLVPWLLYLPGVLVIGLMMGRASGLYATVLATVCALISLALTSATGVPTTQHWITALIFLAVSGVMTAIAGELRDAFGRAAIGAADLKASNAMLVEREEQLQLLNQELGHRLKNQLAIVQAVASQTLRQSGDLRSANEALSSRLAALGRATDVLTRSDWTAADLHTLARTALMAHQSVAGRFRFDGPALSFGPQVSLALTLAFHELMTNAIKYGALSNETGHVKLSWEVQPGPIVEEPRFTLTWQEIGGPPVRPPSRRGFGSLMIERSLRSYFRGDTSIAYEPEGLVFRIEAPLGEAREG